MLNPFRNYIVGDPWEAAEANVEEIGKRAFEACCQAIAVTLAQGRTTSVLLYGEPGSGKTHLIRRLRTHLAESTERRWRDALFVYIRLSTSPNMIWRHLRRRIADDLLRMAADGSMHLELLVYRLMASPGSRGGLLDRCKREWVQGTAWDEGAFAQALSVMLRRLPETELASIRLFDALEGEESCPPGLMQALRNLVQRRNLALVRAWFRGDSLSGSDLERLGIAEDALQEESPEDAAREFVLALTRQAGARMPMILCFDQIEALQSDSGRGFGFDTFSRTASLLHDETSNLVLISCIQSAILGRFGGPDYDRMAEWKVLLPPLDRREAMRLIEARGAGRSAWTIPREELEPVFNEQGEASARSVLARAAALFDRAHARRRPQVSAASYLQQEWDQRVDAAVESLAKGDVDEVLDQGIQGLMGLVGGDWKARGERGDIDFRLDSPTGQIAVSLCNHKNMRSLLARLRRLRASTTDGRTKRLVVLRDPRLPISKHARVTRQQMEQLAQQGVRFVYPSLEALQALEALRTLLADARSGDLIQDGTSIGPETVQEWIAQNLPASLRKLGEEITQQEPAVSFEFGADLLALLELRCIMTLDEAAKDLRQEIAPVRRWALSSPELAGFLEGPPSVLFRIVSAAARG